MSVLIERVVRVNGEERQRSTVVAEYSTVEKIILPVATIMPPLLERAQIEIELTFDPPLSPPSNSGGSGGEA
jgi:hypothetical protein